VPRFVSQFSVDESNVPSRPSTPLARGGKGLLSGSPASPVPRLPPTHALQPAQPIQTPQQFYDWFGTIDRSVAHAQEAHFRAHLADVGEHLDTCDHLVERIDEVEREVVDMLTQWRSVEEGGESLKGACEKLLEERVCSKRNRWDAGR
jgi:conserved oligomeric Golgi complex subunit 3